MTTHKNSTDVQNDIILRCSKVTLSNSLEINWTTYTMHWPGYTDYRFWVEKSRVLPLYIVVDCWSKVHCIAQEWLAWLHWLPFLEWKNIRICLYTVMDCWTKLDCIAQQWLAWQHCQAGCTDYHFRVEKSWVLCLYTLADCWSKLDCIAQQWLAWQHCQGHCQAGCTGWTDYHF